MYGVCIGDQLGYSRLKLYIGIILMKNKGRFDDYWVSY